MNKPLDLTATRLDTTSDATASMNTQMLARTQPQEQAGLDYIPAAQMDTLHALFRARVARSPEKIAYRQFDPQTNQWLSYRWREIDERVQHWRRRFASEGLTVGDRVAIRHTNGINWVIFDQAALSLGLVTVPLYVDDRPDNVAYVIEDSGARLVYLEHAEQWNSQLSASQPLQTPIRIVVERDTPEAPLDRGDPRVKTLAEWLEAPATGRELPIACTADGLASIVYTSGTTGRPKGVMLTHANIASNVRGGLSSVSLYATDSLLSFLPMSHTLERTAGYYMPIMSGSEVIFARSVAELAEDLVNHKPTVLISVPRIYERVHLKLQTKLQVGSPLKRKLFGLAVETGWLRFQHEQGLVAWSPRLLLWPLLDRLVASKVRERLGGRLRFAVSGGAPLPASISRIFIALGINILQGYGLTESSPVIAVNTLQANRPDSVGLPLDGVEVRIIENQELIARGPNLMRGYWNNDAATHATIDADGWLHTGDQARIDEQGFIYITGRLKEILVLANGEKVPPADLESAIVEDTLFDQVLIIGEQKPYLSALIVLNEEQIASIPELAGSLSDPRAEAYVLRRIGERLSGFPGYARIVRVALLLEPWTVFNGLATPTMKLKRATILQRYDREVAQMYQGH
ncbi:MAG: AMP-dependent synthetase/ligase [Thiotrichales bacterium]